MRNKRIRRHPVHNESGEPAHEVEPVIDTPDWILLNATGSGLSDGIGCLLWPALLVRAAQALPHLPRMPRRRH